jgi:valyl-tRNA synthetase
MTVDGQDTAVDSGEVKLGLAERWINSRLQQTIHDVTDALNAYRFDLAAQAIHEFTWDEYCDWYLEFSKTVTNSDKSTAAAKRGTCQVLLGVLETLLRLAHPFLPFITEEIWSRLAPRGGIKGPSVMVQAYPKPDDPKIDQDALKQVDWLKTFILGVRRIRAEMNIPPGRALRVLVRGGTSDENQWLHANLPYVVTLAKIESLGALRSDKAPEAATALAGDMTLLIPLADIIDPEAETSRLAKELDKLRTDHRQSQAKLSNANFLERAPAEVVAKEQERFEERRSAIAQLEEQLARIQSMRSPP